MNEWVFCTVVYHVISDRQKALMSKGLPQTDLWRSHEMKFKILSFQKHFKIVNYSNRIFELKKKKRGRKKQTMQTHKPPSFIFTLELFILTFLCKHIWFPISYMFYNHFICQLIKNFWKTRFWVHSLKSTPSFTIVID